MINWQWCKFDALSGREMYAILKLRCEVFIVEQNCVYQDVDGLDPACWHLLGWRAGAEGGPAQLVAYLRGMGPGVKFDEASIGRVMTHASARRGGAGRELMAQGLARMQQQFPGVPLKIGAQCYLQAFYESFGFVQCSAEYDEDGIPHMDMLRRAEAV
jgi:ElaA protein